MLNIVAVCVLLNAMKMIICLLFVGVSSLISLLKKRQDEESPRLNILLTESLLSVYMSLLCYALAMFDAIIFYRLVGHPLIDSIWSVLFGGGLKKLVRASTPADVGRKSCRAVSYYVLIYLQPYRLPMLPYAQPLKWFYPHSLI